MAVAAADPALEVIRIAALVEHIVVVVCFQENSMALTEMADHVLAGNAYIGKYAHPDVVEGDYEAAGVDGIMKFGKCGYLQLADHCYMRDSKRTEQIFINGQAAAHQRGRRDVYRKLVFFRKDGDAVDMVGMLMRNEDSFYLTHG